MKINVNKNDLINMISGCEPDYSWRRYLRDCDMITFGFTGELKWDRNELEKYDKKTLYLFYTALKKKCPIENDNKSFFSWGKSADYIMENIKEYIENAE